jgi:outer membrane protein assembly factor BamB
MKLRLYSWLRKARKISSFLFLPIFVLGLAGCLPFSASSDSEPTPASVNHRVEGNNGLSELWSRNDAYVLWGNKALDASMGTVCFLGDLGTISQSNQIVCLDSESGDIKWKRETSLGGILMASPKGVFVTYTSLPNTLSRYDLQSGDMIWQEKWYESNPLHMLFFDNQVQLITMKPGRKLWVFDTEGNVVRIIDDTEAFLTTPEVTYFSENGIRALRTDTKEVLWYYQDPTLNLVPVFTEDKIFCRNEGNSGTVYALDRITGELLWQVHDIVYRSSIAHSPEKQLVYALRNNGDLLAINENTGETSIAVRFTSTPFLFIGSGTGQDYELAYDEEKHILLVSLGDGHQVFAFREE